MGDIRASFFSFDRGGRAGIYGPSEKSTFDLNTTRRTA